GQGDVHALLVKERDEAHTLNQRNIAEFAEVGRQLKEVAQQRDDALEKYNKANDELYRLKDMQRHLREVRVGNRDLWLCVREGKVIHASSVLAASSDGAYHVKVRWQNGDPSARFFSTSNRAQNSDRGSEVPTVLVSRKDGISFINQKGQPEKLGTHLEIPQTVWPAGLPDLLITVDAVSKFVDGEFNGTKLLGQKPEPPTET
ncbi:MAG: hypothetical protein Q7R88_02200, partial [bacterium]|nr:hypothetical protein [bacterium]